jgi:outer membrane protein assembly factor BamB
MKRTCLLNLIILSAVTCFTLTLNGQVIPERQWPGYRGFMASGVLDNAGLPDSFDFQKMTNVRWKKEIPGLGLSSPVIWGDKLFLTSAISKADDQGIKTGIYGDGMPVADSSVHDWKVYCIDKNTGKMIWERTAFTGIPKIRRHPKSTHANASVATDGKYAVAFFGSEGLYCYDYEGNLVWKKNFGILKSVAYNYNAAEWEFASSPIIYNGVLVIQCDVLENSFIAAYDLKSGRELWKTNRDEYPGWSTPNIYKSGDKVRIAVNGYKHRGGYDFSTGQEIWRMSGGGDVPIPTPIIGKDLIYFNSAHGPSSPIYAIKSDATGDLTAKPTGVLSESVKWSIPRGGSYIHTMLLYRDHLYNVNWNGSIVCYDASTGKELYNAKIGNSQSFIASPVAADGKVYIVDEKGTIYILQDGTSFRQLASIPMNDNCLTAPSITDGIIFFRTQKYLYAVGKK